MRRRGVVARVLCVCFDLKILKNECLECILEKEAVGQEVEGVHHVTVSRLSRARVM